MFIVPEKYNVVLTFSPIEEITGHWFEVYEYYYFLKRHGLKPCMLFQSPNVNEIIISKTLQDKYVNCSVLEDFYVLSYEEKLIGCPLAVVIVCDGNFKSLREKGIKIDQTLKRTRYRYDIGKMITNIKQS